MYRINLGSYLGTDQIFFILFIEPVSVQINYYISVNLATSTRF